MIIENDACTYSCVPTAVDMLVIKLILERILLRISAKSTKLVNPKVYSRVRISDRHQI